MATYLLQIAYTPEAWAAMAKNPQDRIAAVRPSIEKMGGKITSGYLCFGDYDLVAIMEMPGNVDAAAFAISVAAGGACSKVHTTPLSQHEGWRRRDEEGRRLDLQAGDRASLVPPEITGLESFSRSHCEIRRRENTPTSEQSASLNCPICANGGAVASAPVEAEEAN